MIDKAKLLDGEDDFAKGYNAAIREVVWPLTNYANQVIHERSIYTRAFAAAVHTMGEIRVSHSILRRDLAFERIEDPSKDEYTYRPVKVTRA